VSGAAAAIGEQLPESVRARAVLQPGAYPWAHATCVQQTAGRCGHPAAERAGCGHPSCIGQRGWSTRWHGIGDEEHGGSRGEIFFGQVVSGYCVGEPLLRHGPTDAAQQMLPCGPAARMVKVQEGERGWPAGKKLCWAGAVSCKHANCGVSMGSGTAGEKGIVFLVPSHLTALCCCVFVRPGMVSLRLQKRLAASVLKCGTGKIWLDPNEVNEISMANSRQNIRKLVSDARSTLALLGRDPNPQRMYLCPLSTAGVAAGYL